jgi:hypothetical protein
MMIIDVTCEGCGNRWQSHAASGRTECRSCGCRIYIPVAVRKAAGVNVDSARSFSRSEVRGVSRTSPLPAADIPPTRFRSTTRHPPEIARPRGVVSPWTSIDKMLTALRAHPTSPAPTNHPTTTPVAAWSQPAPQPPAPRRSGRHFLVVDGTCGCTLIVGSPNVPAQVRCPSHGRVETRSPRRVADPPAGARYAGLVG